MNLFHHEDSTNKHRQEAHLLFSKSRLYCVVWNSRAA